ncbi:hypothetical protein DRO54_00620 [Candidatus Bathyarchaeota archaeon]|nr:MAG: hypothetical protein DRO54_00620 [Candidatus Bathyarchaeota archaeon]
MKGALVFLVVFIIFLIATIGYPLIPPGKALYRLLGVPETEYPVLGVSASLLVKAIINGVIYGVIAWLVFTLVTRMRKGRSVTS